MPQNRILLFKFLVFISHFLFENNPNLRWVQTLALSTTICNSLHFVLAFTRRWSNTVGKLRSGWAWAPDHEGNLGRARASGCARAPVWARASSFPGAPGRARSLGRAKAPSCGGYSSCAGALSSRRALNRAAALFAKLQIAFVGMCTSANLIRGGAEGPIFFF